MELTADSTEDIVEKRAQARRNATTKVNVENYLEWREQLPKEPTARILSVMERYGKKAKDRSVAEEALLSYFKRSEHTTVRSLLARLRAERYMSYRQRNTGKGVLRYWRMRNDSLLGAN